MLGPLVNTAAIIVCAFSRPFYSQKSARKIRRNHQKAIGLSIIFIGISGALENKRVMLLIFSMVIGSVIGELIDIDGGMNRLGNWAEKKLGFSRYLFKGLRDGEHPFLHGIDGHCRRLEQWVSGDHETLFAKSILDGVISIVFASSMGIGVAFSAVPVSI